MTFRANDATATSVSNVFSGFGFFSAQRASSTNMAVWRDGIRVINSVQASTALANNDIGVGHAIGATGSYTTNRVSFAAVGDGSLTAAQMQAFSDAVYTYLYAVGTIPLPTTAGQVAPAGSLYAGDTLSCGDDFSSLSVVGPSNPYGTYYNASISRRYQCWSAR